MRKAPVRSVGIIAVALELTILMPCLNEKGTLAACIHRAQAFLQREEISGEIIVADNGSTDGSFELAKTCGVRVVHVPLHGHGAALAAGFEAARGE